MKEKTLRMRNMAIRILNETERKKGLSAPMCLGLKLIFSKLIFSNEGKVEKRIKKNSKYYSRLSFFRHCCETYFIALQGLLKIIKLGHPNAACLIVSLLTLSLGLVSCQRKNLESNLATQLSSQILHLKKDIESLPGISDPKKTLCRERPCLFLSVWDFDGTIIKGDCTEGLVENDQLVYMGLAQRTIEQGFSNKYSVESVETGYAAFQADYKNLLSISKERAYASILSIMVGQRSDDILQLSQQAFERELKNYYFQTSIDILDTMHENGINNFVLSASPSLFVQGSHSSLVVSRQNIIGIDSELIEGIVGDKILQPMTYGVGKRMKLQAIIADLKAKHQTPHVYVLAGFGNSHHTDGAFLQFIAEQRLPVGKALTVMINAHDAPGEFEGLFTNVTLNQIASAK